VVLSMAALTHLVLLGFLMFPASVTLYMRESNAYRQACAHC
jgi:cytochrome C oxidase subunit IV